MQTRALHTLVQLSKTGSFTKAAEELNMTLSALSMQMKALEGELGVDLFDRSVRPPKLTPLARSIVAEAAVVLQREARIIDLCKPREDIVGRYRMGFVTTAAVRLLPGFVKTAQTAAPRAEFEFETGLSKTLQDKVVSGQLDAAVVTDADGLPDGVDSVELRQEPFVFAASDSILSGGLPGLIARHRFFHFMPDTGIGKLIAQEMESFTRPDGAKTVVLDSLEAIMECVAEGLGFTLLPVPDVERLLAKDVRMLEAPTTRTRRLALIAPSGSALAKRLPMLARLFDVVV
ncbi:MAG: LysR family transcriptional regulator [Pseudomonadota bacterium]